MDSYRNQSAAPAPEQNDEKGYKIFISYTHWGDPEKNGIRRYTRWLNLFPILRRYLKARRLNNAFVYCHDYFEACRLESGLRSFSFPRKLRKKYGIGKKRPVTVFRDESELTNGELTSSIQDALRRTDYLLVVHSRHSRQKPWISKEISYFLESGRSSDHLIHWAIDGNPFISLTTKKTAGSQPALTVHPDECIPPVVLQLYPDKDHTSVVIDKNVEKPAKGFHYRLDRAIGAAYNLSPSELRSIAFRRRLRNLGWWLLLLLLIGVGCTARYYLHTDTRYYVNYVPRYNIPYGITEIRKDRTPYYQTHVVLQTRAGKVRRYEFRNYKGEPAGDDEVLDPSFGALIVELEYDDRTGKVTQLKSLDEDGVLQQVFTVYSDSLIGLNKQNGEFATMTTLDNSQSDFSYLRIRRNERGEVIRMYPLPDNRSDITETTPYVELERNERGLVTRIDQSHANLFPGHDDAVNYTLAYAPDGSVAAMANFNAADVPVLKADGTHRIVLNGQGTRQRTVSYYDTEGKPCLNTQGIYKLIQTVTKDNSGKQFTMRTWAYDTEGHLAKNPLGVHRIDESWKADRSQTAIRYFDADGKAVSQVNGYHTVILRQTDTLKTIAYYDTAGRHTLNLEEGIAMEQIRYAGNRSEKTFYNTRLERCNSITENAGCIVQETDEEGNIVYYATFLHTMVPAWVDSEPPVKRVQYDKKGNRIAVWYENGYGDPASGPDGYCKKKLGYDAYGNICELAFADSTGAAVNGTAGYARLKRTYSDDGRCIETAYFTSDGSYRQPESVIREYTNGNNNAIRREWRDSAGCLAMNPAGYAVVTFAYDATGRQDTCIAFYDEQEKPCLNRDGYHTLRKSYDLWGNEIMSCYRDTASRPVVTDGYSLHRNRYDELGRLTQSESVNELTHESEELRIRYAPDGIDSESTLLENGKVTRRTETRTDIPNHTLTLFVNDAAGNPTREPGVAALTEVIRWPSNQIRQVTFRDGTGHLMIPEERTFAQMINTEPFVYYFFNADSVVSSIEYGSFSEEMEIIRPVTLKGVSKQKFSYGKGWETVCNYNEADSVCLNEEGYAYKTVYRDKKGNLLALRYFDTEYRPCNARTEAGCFASIYQQYGPDGLVSEYGYRDADNEPVDCAQGYSVQQLIHSYDSNYVCFRYDKNGYPVSVSNVARRQGEWLIGPFYEGGYAEVKYRYDSLNRVVHIGFYKSNRMPFTGTEGAERIIRYLGNTFIPRVMDTYTVEHTLLDRLHFTFRDSVLECYMTDNRENRIPILFTGLLNAYNCPDSYDKLQYKQVKEAEEVTCMIYNPATGSHHSELIRFEAGEVVCQGIDSTGQVTRFPEIFPSLMEPLLDNLYLRKQAPG